MSASLRFVLFLALLTFGSSVLPAASSARPGDLLPAFGNGGIAVSAPEPAGREAPADLERLPDGSLLLAGSAGSGSRALLVKFSSDGSVDPAFGDQGRIETDGPGWEQVDLFADGRIMLAGGRASWLVLRRLHGDGSPDLGFGTDGRVKLATTGLFDPEDGMVANTSISSLAVLPDGSVRAIGSFGGCNMDAHSCAEAFIVGLEADGSPSAGFGPDGLKNLGLRGGRVLASTFPDGESLVIQGNYLDPEFGWLTATPVSAGAVPGESINLFDGAGFHFPTLNRYQGGIAVDDEGRVLFTDRDTVFRVFPDGTPDESFGDRGRVDLGDLTRFIPGSPRYYASGIAIDDRGRILISGGVGRDLKGRWPGNSWASSGAVARLTPDGATDVSFGGGGLALAWTGVEAGQNVKERTSLLAGPDGLTVAGMGPVEGSFGFTLARLGNGEMEMPRCNGKVVDYVGTPGRDRVYAHQSVVATLGGDDLVSGGFRATVCAGAGDDFFRAELGPSTVFGGPGRDRIHLADVGSSKTRGGPGNDRLGGGRRPDLRSGMRATT